MEMKKYYISYEKEITQNSLNMCDLIKETVQRYNLAVFSQIQELNAFGHF